MPNDRILTAGLRMPNSFYADVLYYTCRYSYDEQSGTYNEMQGEQTGVDTEIGRDGVTE
jgi:hypothetical protein